MHCLRGTSLGDSGSDLIQGLKTMWDAQPKKLDSGINREGTPNNTLQILTAIPTKARRRCFSWPTKLCSLKCLQPTDPEDTAGSSIFTLMRHNLCTPALFCTQLPCFFGLQSAVHWLYQSQLG